MTNPLAGSNADYVMVPRIPTAEMIDAALWDYECTPSGIAAARGRAYVTYIDMIAAAPTHPDTSGDRMRDNG